jgi:DNA-3-methyladenine glycosylase
MGESFPSPKLPREFYARDAATVARELLGKHLVHVVDGQRRAGRIVETEAYLGPHDRASHTSKGRTPRTEAMFGPPGHAYVYLIYGIYWNMNVVCEAAGVAAGVLIRALEPLENIDGKTRGPGLLCKAMGINKSNYGQDLLGRKLFIETAGSPPPFKIVRTQRIGVDYAGAWAKRLLRFYIEGNAFVSRVRK